MQKTRVCLIDYPRDSEELKIHDVCETIEELKDQINNVNDNDDSVKFRLWVVEDLSRDVIETLGDHYDIDPSFFREHIMDYIWYNISQCFFSCHLNDTSI